MPRVFEAIPVILVALLPCTVAAGPRDLTFEERVRAQEAIERVYYAHQIGATRPFEEAVPGATLERKVRTYLKESLALERLWGAQVTATALREEWERIARSTRMPERLEELHAALGHDAMLIQECLVRPVLVHRLVRQAFASGRAIQSSMQGEASVRGAGLGGGKSEAAGGRPFERRLAAEVIEQRAWDEFRDQAQVEFDERDLHTVASAAGSVMVASPTCGESDTWTPIVVAPNSPSRREGHTAIWTGSHMIVWGGALQEGDVVWLTNTGGRYDPVLDAWTAVSGVNAPTARWFHTAVWTGDRMIIWGGEGQGANYENTGARYDPVGDTWAPTSLISAPPGRAAHTAVWTGSVMIVWGAGPAAYPKSGGRYDPIADTWTPTAILNAPGRRNSHTAVWSGGLMIVWGGVNQFVLNTGGRYDPATDIWLATSVIGAPTARQNHTAVWTGEAMVIWGGTSAGGGTNTGAAYDASADAWTSLSTAGAPAGRHLHTAVWTGEEMVVWGGITGSISGGIVHDTGGRYDPASDTWSATATAGAPTGRYFHSAVLAGDLMLTWGGSIYPGGWSTDDGGEYCICAAGSFYQDADGDSRGDAAISVQACSPPAGFVADGSDCDDTDPAVWGTPSEVQDLVWLDGDTVSWTPPVEPGGAVVVYDLLRSDVAADFGAGAACVESDLPSTNAVDLTTPGSGAAFFYLVRAESRCLVGGQGPLGWASDGTPRTGRSCP